MVDAFDATQSATGGADPHKVLDAILEAAKIKMVEEAEASAGGSAMGGGRGVGAGRWSDEERSARVQVVELRKLMQEVCRVCVVTCSLLLVGES